jgi:surfactin synthase thioesterase subunit
MNELWIRSFHPAPADAVPVLILPYVGGSATAFRPLSARLAPAVRPLIVQLPGRQERHTEPCVDTIPELVEQIHVAMGPLAARPFAIFGHSMGAILGFELARRLEQKHGTPPIHLFASGRRAPSCPREERVHTLPDAGVVAELARLNGTQPELLGDPDIIEMIMPSVRADYRAIETYRPEPDATIGCPITVLTGDADPQTTAAEADVWAAHTTGAFALTTYRGNHFFLNDHLPAIAGLITDTLR